MSWLGPKGNARAAARVTCPRARVQELVVEDVGEEVLIYDQQSDQAHCLSRDAAMVWRVCDGATSSVEVAAALGLDPKVVALAIEEMDDRGLLDSAPGVTRRQATIRMAKVGGAAVAAPLIYSIFAPAPALAASQQFCLGINPCSADSGQTGCASCFKVGCVCCGAGTSGSNKLCTADCAPTECNPCLIHAHCGGTGTMSTCTCGSSGVPGCVNQNKAPCPYISPTTGLDCCTTDAAGNPICASSQCL
jgi:hypothetical protein